LPNRKRQRPHPAQIELELRATHVEASIFTPFDFYDGPGPLMRNYNLHPERILNLV
jgi:hypothetical protein